MIGYVYACIWPGFGNPIKGCPQNVLKNVHNRKRNTHETESLASVQNSVVQGARIYPRKEQSLPLEKECSSLCTETSGQKHVSGCPAGEVREKEVTGPLAARRVYAYQVILTSFSPSEQALKVLIGVPNGALPLQGRPPTWATQTTLQPYSITKLELRFYFPHKVPVPDGRISCALNLIQSSLVISYCVLQLCTMRFNQFQ